MDDYKTTGASANPDVWGRALFGAGHDVQAALYLRGVYALLGVEALFRFVVQENVPPYALSVIGLSPDARMLAEKKVRAAIEAWGHGLATGRFPGYPTRTCYVELPGWEETRWLERELPKPTGVDDGRPIEEQLFGTVGG